MKIPIDSRRAIAAALFATAGVFSLPPARAEVLVFRQGREITLDGVGQGSTYTATQDAELREDAPTTTHDTGTGDPNPEFNVDDNGGGTESQVVMRFDEVFDWIPNGATIAGATLFIDIDNTGNDMSLYRLGGGFAWSEAATTWNNFGSTPNNGVATGVETAGGATLINGAGNKVNIDVTADVQAWYAGAVNNGWAFLPGGMDGVDFDASENFDPADRPSLTIVYHPPQDLVLTQAEEITLNGIGQGTNYTDTHDAELREDAPTTNYDAGTGGTNGEFRVDNNGGGTESQVVVRFGNPFDELPGDAVITGASLFIDIDNIGNDMAFYRLAGGFDWNEATATWNNFGSTANNGVAAGVETVGGATLVDGTGDKVSIDVTADVQAWYAGAANNGWAFLPGGSDAVDFDASENPDSADRPSLTITFTSASSSPINIVRGPYLQQGSTDRVTVRWRTQVPGDSVVRYGTTEGVFDQPAITVGGSRTQHVVDVTGLQPATRYYYQVESNGGGGSQATSPPAADTFFETAPVDNTLDPTTLWVIGDSGTGNANADGVYNGFRSLYGAGEPPHADVWLMLGDNAYDSGTDAEFQTAVFETYPELLRNTILWPTLGNHEAYTAGGAPYLDIFTLPTAGEAGGVASGTERYYSFDRANIHFICLDSETGGNYNDAPGGVGMYDWLEADLQACDKDWIIAFFHHGPYTKGSHDSDSESHHIEMRRYLVPLLESYGVDLVMSGHSHQYERSIFINGHHGPGSGSGTFTAANIVDGGNGSEIGDVDGAGSFVSNPALGDGAYRKPLATANDGAVYAIAGASGKLSNWDNGSAALINPLPHPVHLVNLRLLGSLFIEIDGFTLHAQYIDSSGSVRDDFTILKGSDFEISAPVAGTVEGGAPAQIQVTRSGDMVMDDAVGLTVSGADTGGQVPASLSFAPTETNQSFQVSLPADNLAEGDGVATVSLELTRAAQPGAAQRRAFIPPASASVQLALEDAPSQAWYFNNVGGGPIAPADWSADGDGDGLVRAFEALSGGSEGPNDADKIPAPVVRAATFELHFPRDTRIADLTVSGERSGDLVSWGTQGVSLQREGPANPGGIELWKAAVGLPIPGEDEQFLRLQVTTPAGE